MPFEKIKKKCIEFLKTPEFDCEELWKIIDEPEPDCNCVNSSHLYTVSDMFQVNKTDCRYDFEGFIKEYNLSEYHKVTEVLSLLEKTNFTANGEQCKHRLIPLIEKNKQWEIIVNPDGSKRIKGEKYEEPKIDGCQHED